MTTYSRIIFLSKMDYDHQDFQRWLRQNTPLAEGTIYVYSSSIQEFFKEYDKMSFNNISEFVSQKARESNNTYARAAFLKFFDFLGLDEDKYKKKIPRVKRYPKKRQPVHLTKDQMKRLILHVDIEKYRDIAMLHYNTGARGSEILTIREEKIQRIEVNGQPIIKLILWVKGEKERTTYLNLSIAKKVLKKYLKGRPGFIFLKDDMNDYFETNKFLFWCKLQAQNRNYLRALKRAALKIGLSNVGTHDIRRFFINWAIDKNKDIFLVRDMVGHARVETTAGYSKDRSPEATDAVLKLQEEGL